MVTQRCRRNLKDPNLLLEMKVIKPEMRSALNGMNGRLDVTRKTTSELQGIPTETFLFLD
jgi:hypothetical protein